MATQKNVIYIKMYEESRDFAIFDKLLIIRDIITIFGRL